VLNASHGRDASNSMDAVGKPVVAGKPVTERTPGTAGRQSQQGRSRYSRNRKPPIGTAKMTVINDASNSKDASKSGNLSKKAE